jgi:anti-sigma regulatory factor (Ser/Thr protein kinase)
VSRGFPSHPASSGAARRLVDRALTHLDDETRGLATLLTSEIVTNALIHGRAPVSVTALWSAVAVRVEVTDEGAQMPVRLAAGPDARQGRGLLIVEALAERWGAERLASGGKVVWFELSPDRAEGAVG